MVVTNAIELPRDQYLHPTAPNEWWWHIGTLGAGDRVFGFEINAAMRSMFGQTISFTEIMLTDVQGQIHYEKTTVIPFDPAWAESDQTKPWYCRLTAANGDGSVSMTALASNIESMTVSASFVDAASGETVSFDLNMRQEGQPLLVWGDGVSPKPVGSGTDALQVYNYYYSFTNLQASGTITVGSETYQVKGVTWMDHEYGAFASSQAWVLQDAQLDNGVHLSSFFASTPPVEGQQTPSFVTILTPDGNSTFFNSLTTPLGPLWKSPEGVSYCLTYQVDIEDVGACLTFVSSMPDQEFASQYAPVYEGVATVAGHYGADAVRGTGWIEQALGPLQAKATAVP